MCSLLFLFLYKSSPVNLSAPLSFSSAFLLAARKLNSCSKRWRNTFESCRLPPSYHPGGVSRMSESLKGVRGWAKSSVASWEGALYICDKFSFTPSPHSHFCPCCHSLGEQHALASFWKYVFCLSDGGSLQRINCPPHAFFILKCQNIVCYHEQALNANFSCPAVAEHPEPCLPPF